MPAMPTKEIDELIDQLSQEDGLTRACQRAEEWAAGGKVGALLTLATALEERCDAKQLAVFESVTDHVEDQVALSKGTEAVDAVLALARGDRTKTVLIPRPRAMRLRAFASRLGYGQEAETFLATLDRAGEKPEHQEILACWLHEVVLRGASIANDPRARRFHERLASTKHPLGSMPIALLGVENEAPSYMPLYGEKGLGGAIAALERGPMSAKTVPPPADGAVAKATKLDDAKLVDRLATAVRPWSDASNGKIEAKLFALEPPVDVGAVGSWLLRMLPLESTAGQARLDVQRTPADTVFGALFSAASNGGAYSAGLGGAYGRLAAWTSLAALVGAAEDATVEQIDEAASRCTFLTFRAPGPWFHDVAWDLGALCLRADGKSVAVLAATDKD